MNKNNSYEISSKKIGAIERMNFILKHLKETPNTLGIKIGFKGGQGIRDVLSEKKETVGISKNLADAIVKKYPSFSWNWIMSGEGDKFISNNDNFVNELPTEYKKGISEKADSPLHAIINLTESNRLLAQSNAELVAIIKEDRKGLTVDEKVKKDKAEIKEFFVELEKILKSGSEKEREFYLKKMQELGVVVK